jgi:hypothetical protein
MQTIANQSKKSLHEKDLRSSLKSKNLRDECAEKWRDEMLNLHFYHLTGKPLIKGFHLTKERGN